MAALIIGLSALILLLTVLLVVNIKYSLKLEQVIDALDDEIDEKDMIIEQLEFVMNENRVKR